MSEVGQDLMYGIFLSPDDLKLLDLKYGYENSWYYIELHFSDVYVKPEHELSYKTVSLTNNILIVTQGGGSRFANPMVDPQYGCYCGITFGAWSLLPKAFKRKLEIPASVKTDWKLVYECLKEAGIKNRRAGLHLVYWGES
tara:strand:- start:94 stop:516 length:423 start_codon:yes stop_codon:yes gene_type:complete